MRNYEADLRAQWVGPADNWRTIVPAVMESDVEAVVSAWTGIPAEQLSQDDKDRLMGLDQALKVSKDALYL